MANKEPAPEGAGADTSAQSTPPETRTPDEWAREYFPTTSNGRRHPERWKHSAAEALHGWTVEEHHAGKALQLTRADYEAALKAASQPLPRPHGPALSRYFRKKKGH